VRNIVKEKLLRGEAVTGTFVQIGHSDVTEILSHIGFDYLILDGEHGPMSVETMQAMMQAMSGTNCLPFVRAEWNDPVQIKRILDIGAYGVLIPMVDSREEAENAVRACRYPPQGIRGFAPRRPALADPDYFKTANDAILVAVQIESEKSLNNLDGILSVPGVDAVFIGPYDLACNLGYGVPPPWDNPDYLAAFDRVIEAARKHGKAAGMYANPQNIEWALKKGFRFNALSTADNFLREGAKSALERARAAAPGGKTAY
jgi:2-keto-3-deoxy-L-rhamnonate aldolase RhmA